MAFTLKPLRSFLAAAEAGQVSAAARAVNVSQSAMTLALRDLDSWLASAEFIYTKYPATDKDIAIVRRMHIYESVTFDRAKFIDAYHRYHADVRRYFKDRPNDLLEMSIVDGDGWEKLCPFLKLPVPAEPFPHNNKRTDDYPAAKPAHHSAAQTKAELVAFP